jgi:hypothetical protein
MGLEPKTTQLFNDPRMAPQILFKELTEKAQDVNVARRDVNAKIAHDNVVFGMVLSAFCLNVPPGMSWKMHLAAQTIGVVGAFVAREMYMYQRLQVQDDGLRRCATKYAMLLGGVTLWMDTPVNPGTHPYDTRKQLEEFWKIKQDTDKCFKESYHPTKYHTIDFVRKVLDVFKK